MPETEPAERTGSRAERSKRGRFAWEEKPKTENAFEDNYDFRTRTRIDKSETTKSAIDRPRSEIVLIVGPSPMLVKSSLNW